MLELLQNYLLDKSEYIILLDNGLLIKNCSRLLNIDENFINFIVGDKSVIVKGKKFRLISNVNYDIEIHGKIESIKIND